MTVMELAEKLSLEPVCEAEPDREVTGGYAGDLLSWVMGRAQSGDAWITIMSNNNVVAVATLTDAALVILAENVSPDPGVTQLAERKGINLYRSPEPIFTLCAKVAALL
ncbi:MAG: hypothetical protein IKQ54_09325 [Oscillospiraceae bacterium]|nr:hypothetical protein [Oscillospiraceae bacterium]MBR4194511.1 hypothetical protein [Oscillospiraceae bacterium]